MQAVTAFDVAAAAVCVGAALAGLRVAAWLRAYLILRRLPGPQGHLVLGQLGDVVKPDHHRTLHKWACKYGGIYHMRLAHIHAVVVTDPQLIAEVLGKDTEVEKSVEGVYSHFNILLHAKAKPNIFTSPTDAYWRLVRKGVAPAFSVKNIRQGFGHVVAVNQQLASKLAMRAGTAVDMDNAALRVTLDVIGRVGFGKDFAATASLDDPRANAAFDLMGAGRDEGIKRWNSPLRKYLVFLPDVRRGRRELARFRAMMAGLLAEVRARGEPAPADATIAAHLLRIRDPATCRALPDDRLAAEIGVFFTGGFETTGHTIAWALLMISQHARVEAAVLAELRGLHLLPHQARRRALEYEDLARLTYTGQAIKEAMRLMPVLTDGTNRTAGRDMRVGPHHIPAGTMVWVPFGAVFASPRCWERADEYLPERWDDADAEYARPLGDEPGVKQRPVSSTAEAARAKRFLPFSLGARDCVGQSLARMNFTATVAMLVSEFSFRLADEMGGLERVRDRATSGLLTLQPADGLLMHCTPRNPEAAAG